MALSQQVTPAYVLKVFMRWAKVNGYRVGEHPDYGGVAPGVHAAGSWHADGLAADINWGTGNPPGERAKLLTALKVAQSMGLAITYARDGTTGTAATHQGHLHVDVGEWSNYGSGTVRRRTGSLTPYRLQRAVFRSPTHCDNLWGAETNRRLHAVRVASNLHGTRFPYGVEYTRRVIDTTPTETWDTTARKAHDAAVRKIQEALNVTEDGIWGKATDRAFTSAKTRYKR